MSSASSQPPASRPATVESDASIAWVATLLQASDSFYPTGSYAHSFGLEGLVQAGAVRDRPTLRDYLRLSVVPTLRQVELPLTVHFWRALGEEDWGAVRELAELSAALKTSSEARQAADNIGRQRLTLLQSLRPAALTATCVAEAQAGRWPHSPALAAAVEGLAAGTPLPAALTGVYYGTMAALVSAAMKLLRLGQNGSQSLLTELLGEAGTTVGAALVVPREEIGWFNPWLDIAAARHAHADSRMFIS